jgi:lipoprotein-releasing system ATP-binding protein
MSEFLAVHGLRKSFPYGGGRLEVLKGVELALDRGGFASVIGDSGCGKSTLLHILGGMEAPDDGEVRLDGQSVYALDPERRALFRNRAVGFVFQFHHLLPEFTALENLSMPLRIRGVEAGATVAPAERLAAELGLSHRLQSLPGELSGGEQQRLAVGRALIAEPALLLMDEPTGNLDHGTGDRVMEMVFDLTARRGTTAVLVTHNPDLAERCARRFRMADGLLHEL